MTSSTPTILIADDDNDLLVALTRRCQQIGLDVISVANALDALNAANEKQPDVICMDVELPGGNGLAASEMFLNDVRFSSTPIIIMTGRSDTDVERRCNELPAYYIPKSANTWERLQPLLRELLELDKRANFTDPNNALSGPKEAHDNPHTTEELLDVVFALMSRETSILDDVLPTPKPWVLCIDDDYDFSKVLSRRLEKIGVGVINAYDGADGFNKAFMQPASLIILDYNMPNGQGDFVLQRLKETPATRDTPVIVLTGNKNDEVRRTMLNLGADAFLYKPPEFSNLLNELKRFISIPSQLSATI